MARSKRERLEQQILPLLRCMQCESEEMLRLEGDTITCPSCGATYPVHRDVPVMLEDPGPAIAYAEEVVVENGYSPQWHALIERASPGWVLDLGAGNNPEVHPNLVKLDIFALPNADVAGRAERLPFRDGVFQTVMSCAVFEHVRNPHASIAEARRVLRDAGDVYIETAFLQPVHAYPGHYFNMTRMGLEELCQGFGKIASGVQPHQYPSLTAAWVLEAMARNMAKRDRKSFLNSSVREVIREYRANPFSQRWIRGFSPEGIEELACGVFFHGRKGEVGTEERELPSTGGPVPNRRKTFLRRLRERLFG